MAGIVLLSAFSGCIWSFMILKTPPQKIDYWLYEKWKSKTIITMKNSMNIDLIDNDHLDMARDFKRREFTNTISFIMKKNCEN